MSGRMSTQSDLTTRATPAQRSRFVAVLARTGSVAEAAESAGIHPETGRRWIRADPDLLGAVHAAREIVIRSEGAGLALRVLLEMVERDTTPANVRLQAAKLLLETAGHSAAGAAADVARARDAAALQDLSADQLERMIAAARGTLDQLRRQVAVVDVTPAVTPDSPEIASLF